MRSIEKGKHQEVDLLYQLNSPEELLDYMQKNIQYGFVSKEGKIYKNQYSKEWENDWLMYYRLQSGEELVKSHYGVCWDQVELERLWFSHNHYQYKTIFMWFELNKPNNLPTHSFLAFEKAGKWYWFEYAFEPFKGIHEFDNYDLLVECVKEAHFKYARMIDSSISKDSLKCYEYEKPNVHLCVDEYINHVLGNQKEYKK